MRIYDETRWRRPYREIFNYRAFLPSTHSSKMGGTSGAGVETIKHSALCDNLPRFACIFFYFRQQKLYEYI